jgi:predicted DNA-binding transcriptional regulator AlpA
MNDVTAKPKLWLPKTLADYLGVPVSWVYKRTKKKNPPEIIPHVKLGKYVRFDPESSAFRDWLAAHSSSPESLTAVPPESRVAGTTERAGLIH